MKQINNMTLTNKVILYTAIISFCLFVVIFLQTLMDINAYYKQQHKIISDFNMQKLNEKKLAAEDKRLNKTRLKFFSVVFILILIFIFA